MLVSGDKDFAIAQDHAISDFKGIYPEGRVIQVEGVRALLSGGYS